MCYDEVARSGGIHMKLIGACIAIWLTLGVAGAASVYVRRSVTIGDVAFGPFTLAHELQRD